MADLSKLFVLVPANLDVQVDTVKAKSLETGNTQKVYFVEKYNQIVAHGVAYGIDPKSSKELSTLLSTLGATVAADGTVSFDLSKLNYKGDATTILGVIEALDAKLKAEMEKLAASKTLNENWEFSGSIKYVAATAETPAHIALVDEDNKELSTVAVSDIIGNGILDHSQYVKETGVLKLFFKNASGSVSEVDIDLQDMFDIDDVIIAEDSKDYLKTRITGTVVSYKKISDGTTITVEAYNALSDEDKALYEAVYDEKGIELGTKIVKMSEVSETKTGLVDAKDVKDYIDGKTTDLTVKAEGDTFIHAYVDASDNKKVWVSAYNGDLNVTKTGAADSVLSGDANKFVSGSKIATYVGSYVNARISEELAKVNVTSYDLSNGNIHLTYAQTAGYVSVSGLSLDYAGVEFTTPTEGDSTLVVTDGTKLATGADVAKAAQFTEARIAEEIAKLDSSFDKKDAKEYVNVKATIENGKLDKDNCSVAVTYSELTTANAKNTASNGIVTNEVLASAINGLWETWESTPVTEPQA